MFKKKINQLKEFIRLIKNASFRKIDGSGKKYPKVLQLPITYKCNSKCIMCNIWRMDHSNEVDVSEFSKFIKDSIFREIEFVGINGGEPSLVKNLVDYAEKILELPKIKGLTIISNGFNKEDLLSSLEGIYQLCKRKNVRLHISISLDGINSIHSKVRRIPNAFEKTISTIDEIMKNRNKYCDSFDVACTVLKQNVNYLVELDTYAEIKQYNIKYRLGIDNKRIESDKLMRSFSVLYSPLKQSAKEFFHFQMTKEKNLVNKFKYFAIFYWLNSEKPKRLLGCMWKEEGITMDSRGEIYYCAVASDSIGSLRKEKGEDIFFKEENIKYRMKIVSSKCDNCIHDYSGKIEIGSILIFLKELLKDKYSLKLYKIKAKLGI